MVNRATCKGVMVEQVSGGVVKLDLQFTVFKGAATFQNRKVMLLYNGSFNQVLISFVDFTHS